jgi:hypothetical protein
MCSSTLFVRALLDTAAGINASSYCHCAVAAMQAPYGGAINGQEDDGVVELHGCKLVGNTATDKGGAVHVESEKFSFVATDTLFADNMVRAAAGMVEHVCVLASCWRQQSCSAQQKMPPSLCRRALLLPSRIMRQYKQRSLASHQRLLPQASVRRCTKHALLPPLQLHCCRLMSWGCSGSHCIKTADLATPTALYATG